MSDNIEKYIHKEMDNQAGIDHSYHRTKIVATVGPACDTYEKITRAGTRRRKCISPEFFTRLTRRQSKKLSKTSAELMMKNLSTFLYSAIYKALSCA